MKRKIIIPALIVVILAIIAGIVFTSANRKYEIPILMYHNLCVDEADVNSQTVTSEKFESDLAWLKSHGYKTILPCDMAIDASRVEDFKAPKKTVMITFDDGYRSNYELAYPLLKKYGMSAEISVITSLIDQAEDTYINFCTWDMLREMAGSGIIEIGSHTDNMHNPDNGGNMYQGEPNGIGRYTAGEVYNDVKLSCEKIYEKTGAYPITFAYPYGETNRDADHNIDGIFAVSFTTTPEMGNVKNNMMRMGRYRVEQNTDLSKILK